MSQNPQRTALGKDRMLPRMRKHTHLRAQGRQVQLRRLQPHLLRSLGNRLREHQNQPPQVVHGHVPHQQPQEGHILRPTRAGHQGHTEDRMVHAAQDKTPLRTVSRQARGKGGDGRDVPRRQGDQQAREQEGGGNAREVNQDQDPNIRNGGARGRGEGFGRGEHEGGDAYAHSEAVCDREQRGVH